MKTLDDEPLFNHEPTAAQWILYRRHRAKGTTPGNPKWYKSTVIASRPAFVPHLPPKYPHIETGAQWRVKWYGDGKDPWKEVRGKDGGAYIKAYRDALGLKA